jgi:hypothetical protein
MRNSHALGSFHNIHSNMIVAELINRIREDLRLLTSLSESLAILDMMVNSFANLILTKLVETYIRLEFTSKNSQNDVEF